jgi:hypothetical protein
MKSSFIALMLVALLAVPFFLIAQESFPSLKTVEPTSVKAGAVVSAAGENLGKDNVAEVLLTDGKSDVHVEITEQSAASIKFKVPNSAKPGRFSLVIRTTTTPPREYQQPVKLTVE